MTNDSVGGWLVPSLSGERAVSMRSAPASITAWYVSCAIPLVQCVCTTIGTVITSFNARTSSIPRAGVKIPAMSFTQIESAPISCIFAASSL